MGCKSSSCPFTDCCIRTLVDSICNNAAFDGSGSTPKMFCFNPFCKHQIGYSDPFCHFCLHFRTQIAANKGELELDTSSASGLNVKMCAHSWFRLTCVKWNRNRNSIRIGPSWRNVHNPFRLSSHEALCLLSTHSRKGLAPGHNVAESSTGRLSSSINGYWLSVAMKLQAPTSNCTECCASRRGTAPPPYTLMTIIGNVLKNVFKSAKSCDDCENSREISGSDLKAALNMQSPEWDWWIVVKGSSHCLCPTFHSKQAAKSANLLSPQPP